MSHFRTISNPSAYNNWSYFSKLSKILPENLQIIMYTEMNSKVGIWQGGALNLSQVPPAPKQLNLNKLSDAGGLKGSGCPTLQKNQLLSSFRYKVLKLRFYPRK